jgi:phage gp29-like protein
MSKATIGTTTTLESGPNGDRASAETRDKVRSDIREADCRAVAGPLRRHLFIPAVAVNLGADVRCPVPWFQTEESEDRKHFAEAVKTLVEAGLDVPAKWVRDEVGMPEPLEGEETLAKTQVQVPGDGDEDEDPKEPAQDDEDTEKRIKAVDDQSSDNGREYTDRLEQSAIDAGAQELALTVAGMISAVQKAGSYQEARQAILEKYRGLEPPRNLAELTEAALLLGQAAGQVAVLEETPELTSKP